MYYHTYCTIIVVIDNNQIRVLVLILELVCVTLPPLLVMIVLQHFVALLQTNKKNIETQNIEWHMRIIQWY